MADMSPTRQSGGEEEGVDGSELDFANILPLLDLRGAVVGRILE
jgi:hypothetical protein